MQVSVPRGMVWVTRPPVARLLAVTSAWRLSPALWQRPSQQRVCAVHLCIAVCADDVLNGGPWMWTACTELVNSEQVRGKIVMVTRGTCVFIEKVRNVQKAGGIGAVVINNENTVIQMGGTDEFVTTPAVLVSSSVCGSPLLCD